MVYAAGIGRDSGAKDMPTENRNMDSMLTASQPFKSAPGSGVMERECRDNVKPAMLVASELRTGAILRGNYTMRCNHCREWNGEEEHRCRRCGRRLMAGGFDTSAGLHHIQ